jgi:hypothetical protein
VDHASDTTDPAGTPKFLWVVVTTVWLTGGTSLRYRRNVDERSGTGRRALSTGELLLALFGLAVLAFGIGAGLEWTGLGWGLLPVAAVLLGFAFALAVTRIRGPAPSRPVVTMDAAEAMPRLRIRSVPRPRATYYYLAAAGGAALALTLGALLMLALPGDATALVLLLAGVLTWTVVVLLSLRLQLRR